MLAKVSSKSIPCIVCFGSREKHFKTVKNSNLVQTCLAPARGSRSGLLELTHMLAKIAKRHAQAFILANLAVADVQELDPGFTPSKQFKAWLKTLQAVEDAAEVLAGQCAACAALPREQDAQRAALKAARQFLASPNVRMGFPWAIAMPDFRGTKLSETPTCHNPQAFRSSTNNVVWYMPQPGLPSQLANVIMLWSTMRVGDYGMINADPVNRVCTVHDTFGVLPGCDSLEFDVEPIPGWEAVVNMLEPCVSTVPANDSGHGLIVNVETLKHTRVSVSGLEPYASVTIQGVVVVQSPTGETSRQVLYLEAENAACRDTTIGPLVSSRFSKVSIQAFPVSPETKEIFDETLSKARPAFGCSGMGIVTLEKLQASYSSHARHKVPERVCVVDAYHIRMVEAPLEQLFTCYVDGMDIIFFSHFAACQQALKLPDALGPHLPAVSVMLVPSSFEMPACVVVCTKTAVCVVNASVYTTFFPRASCYLCWELVSKYALKLRRGKIPAVTQDGSMFHLRHLAYATMHKNVLHIFGITDTEGLVVKTLLLDYRNRDRDLRLIITAETQWVFLGPYNLDEKVVVVTPNGPYVPINETRSPAKYCGILMTGGPTAATSSWLDDSSSDNDEKPIYFTSSRHSAFRQPRCGEPLPASVATPTPFRSPVQRHKEFFGKTTTGRSLKFAGKMSASFKAKIGKHEMRKR